MYVLLAWIVVLFWIVGVATGIVSSIFLLELEDGYIFQPAKNFIIKTKIRYASVVSRVALSCKRILRFTLIKNYRKTRQIYISSSRGL